MLSANVVLIEDEPLYDKRVRDVLRPTQHELIASVRSLQSGLKLVRLIHLGVLGRIDAVVLDGNLSAETLDRNGSDAITLTQKMRELGLFGPDDKDGEEGLKVIGFSRNEMWQYGVQVHRDPGKDAVAALPYILNDLQSTDGWMQRE